MYIKDPNSKLVVIGSGNDSEKMKKFISDKKIKNIEVKGFMSGEKLNNEFKKSSFLVLPSIMLENCSISILESYSYSKPVIATRTGGTPEIVKNNNTGLLVDSGDSNNLKKNLSV